MGKRNLIQEITHTPACLMPEYYHLCESSLQQQHQPAPVADVQTLLQQISSLQADLAHAQEELNIARKTLMLERHRYQNLLEGSPCAYIVTDIHGTIRSANHQAAVLFNLSRANLVGKPLHILLATDSQSTLQAVLARLSQARQVTDIEMQVRPLNTQPFAVRLTAAAFAGMAGDPVSVRWLLHDVTGIPNYAMLPGIERALGDAVQTDYADAPYVAYVQPGSGCSIAHKDQRQVLLADVTGLLDPVCDCEDALDRVTHRVVPYLADWCMIDLIDAHGQVYPVALSHQSAEMEDHLLDQIERDSSTAYFFRFILDTIETGNPLILADISHRALRQYSASPVYYDLLVDVGTRSVIVVPLRGRTQIIGVMMLVSAQAAYFSPDDLDLVENLAQRITHAVEHAGRVGQGYARVV